MARLNVALPRALDLNANPSNGGKLYIYQAGTTTTVTTYSDAAMTTAQAHPVLADSAGNFPEVYVPEGDYKVIIKTSADVTLRQTDNVSVAARNSYKTLAELAASKVLGDGDYTTVFGGYNNEPETFKYDAASTLTANGTTVVTATGMGVGRLISTRKKFKTDAEFQADPRPDTWFTSGDFIGVGGPSGYTLQKVSTGESHTTDGGAKFRLMPGVLGYNLAAFGADLTGATLSDDAVKKAGETSLKNGGGDLTWIGDIRISKTIDLREYSERRVVTAQNNYTEIMTGINTPKSSRILWYGGKDLDGRYGTAIIAMASYYAFGSSERSGKGVYFTGRLKGFQIIAPEVPRGHSGGWPLTNRFTTTASNSAGCDFPDLANYPNNPLTKTSLPDAGLPIPNEYASCGIYAELLGGGVTEQTYQERLAFGAWIGIGYAFSFRNNTARWCNCGVAFTGAVTDFDVSVNCYERNAVGMMFQTSSMGKMTLNTVQANYAGCDVLIHTNNHSLTFEQNYFEISPKCVVLRTDSSGDYRNSNIRFIRNHSFGIDAQVVAFDKIYLEENSIRFTDGIPDIDISAGVGTVLGSEQIVVKNNFVPSEGNGGERRTLFTEWAGAYATRVIVARDDFAPTERLTADNVFGRINSREFKKELAAPVDVFKLTIPNASASGVVKVKVQKQRLGTMMTGEFELMYQRVSGSVVDIDKTTPVETKIVLNGTDQNLAVYGIAAVAGGATEDNTIVIREFGAAGSSSANVMVTAEHRSLDGGGWMTVVAS